MEMAFCRQSLERMRVCETGAGGSGGGGSAVFNFSLTAAVNQSVQKMWFIPPKSHRLDDKDAARLRD